MRLIAALVHIICFAILVGAVPPSLSNASPSPTNALTSNPTANPSSPSLTNPTAATISPSTKAASVPSPSVTAATSKPSSSSSTVATSVPTKSVATSAPTKSVSTSVPPVSVATTMAPPSTISLTTIGPILTTIAPVTTTAINSPSITYGSISSVYVSVQYSLSPTSIVGSTPISITITPPLPSGLNFNTNNGVITGLVPLMPSTTSVYYTITVTNSFGQSSSLIFLTYLLPSFVYPSYANFPLKVTTTVTPISTPSGAFTQFSISPNLPAGLNFDPISGAIQGTPLVSYNASQYTIQASNQYLNATSLTQVIGLSFTGQGGNITMNVSHLTTYAGSLVFASGTAQAQVVISSGGGVVASSRLSAPNANGDTWSWNWSLNSTTSTVVELSASGIGSMLMLDVVILGDYPIISIDNPVVLLDNNNMYTNTGISRDPAGGSVSLFANKGTLIQQGNIWSWSLSESDRFTSTFVAITALTSGGTNSVVGYFFLQQSASVTANNIVYTLILGLPYSDFGSSDFNGVLAATGRVTSLDPSVISASYGSRRGLSTSTNSQQTIIQITLNNIPPSVTDKILLSIRQSIGNLEYLNQMRNNYFNGNTLNSLTLSAPPAVTALQLSSSSPRNLLLLPLWAVIVIAIVGAIVLIASGVLIHCKCSKKFKSGFVKGHRTPSIRSPSLNRSPALEKERLFHNKNIEVPSIDDRDFVLETITA